MDFSLPSSWGFHDLHTPPVWCLHCPLVADDAARTLSEKPLASGKTLPMERALTEGTCGRNAGDCKTCKCNHLGNRNFPKLGIFEIQEFPNPQPQKLNPGDQGVLGSGKSRKSRKRMAIQRTAIPRTPLIPRTTRVKLGE